MHNLWCYAVPFILLIKSLSFFCFFFLNWTFYSQLFFLIFDKFYLNKLIWHILFSTFKKLMNFILYHFIPNIIVLVIPIFLLFLANLTSKFLFFGKFYLQFLCFFNFRSSILFIFLFFIVKLVPWVFFYFCCLYLAYMIFSSS